VFERFYREQVEMVQRFVARRVDDPYLAADLTADVFVAAIESARSYRRGRGEPTAWLLGIARTLSPMSGGGTQGSGVPACGYAVASSSRRTIWPLRPPLLLRERCTGGDDVSNFEERLLVELRDLVAPRRRLDGRIGQDDALFLPVRW
jgi:hypothetical protein